MRAYIADARVDAVVTDPFSGTGTTALAASELGRTGQGSDVNPFLVWFGGVKTRRYDPQSARDLVAVAQRIARAARGASSDGTLWEPPMHRIGRWWTPKSLVTLRALRAAIDGAGATPALRDLLLVAFCRTMIACSKAAFDHQSMSFKQSAADVDVFALFSDDARFIARSLERTLPGNARVVEHDARALETSGLQTCDLLLTSPPYANRMSYIRELRPYMYWLGYLNDAAAAGELDWMAIGGTWGSATSRLVSWSTDAVTPIEKELRVACERIERDGKKSGAILGRYVLKYFHDVWCHVQSARAIVRPGGRAVYVVGNSSFYGHLVPTETWYAALLRSAGFTRVGVRAIRKRNSKRELFEYAVEATRP